MKGFSVFLAIACTLAFIVWATFRIVFGMTFDIDCGGHLKNAADANTIKLAQQELEIALKYIEGHNLTKGNTGVVFHYPQNDVGFWYKNLKSSHEQLAKISESTTPLSQIEETNALMKLRETLVDHKESGDVVTCPSGIAVFPYNALFLIWGWVSLLGGCLACLIFAVIEIR